MRRGPKRKLFESDYLRARAWYWGVKDASGLPTAEAIEHAISPETFRPRESPSGGFVYPGHFSKIKNGRKSPGNVLITRTEDIFAGTRYWFDHPFWDVLRHPSLPSSVRIFLSKPLQSKYARALFNPPNKFVRERYPERLRAYKESIFRGLDKSGDLDSLTFAVWFLNHFKRDENYDKESADYLSGLVLSIFTKVAAAPPFWDISNDVFKYLNKYFIDLSNDNYWAKSINSGNVDVTIGYNRTVLKFFDDLGILTKHKHAPTFSLGVIEKHIDPVFFGNIADLSLETDRKMILRLPEIRLLIRELKAWEKSASQPLALPYA